MSRFSKLVLAFASLVALAMAAFFVAARGKPVRHGRINPSVPFPVLEQSETQPERGADQPSAETPSAETPTAETRGAETRGAETRGAETRGAAELATATFASGCFWCTEAVFQRLKGVESVESGYCGGRIRNPSYQMVLSGASGHAEAVRIRFDPNAVSYADLLEVFWRTHDPTTADRQGPDIGSQYRSAIFYHDERQRRLAEYYKRKLDESGVFYSPVVTEIAPAREFYPAEDYHQNFYRDNPGQPYCRAIIEPKLEAMKKIFGNRLK